ncbi:hypothetical protein SDC9_51796 [bioreactor metagenome]|uniref:Type I restriction modification DNA specificity domain-containing protein n=1 Tax=bioreactor metagenome TaxID=1076179 RepID=A0A644WNJ7_9ZZZZ
MEEIKQGYKQTDIGVIPEDWEVKPIGKLGLFSKGNGISRAESNTGIIPCVRYGEIYTTHDNYIKKFYSFISREVANRAKKLKVGDVLFTASGETKEDIGKNVAFIDNIEAYAGGDIIILSPKNADSLFLGYLFNAPYVVTQKANKGQGDAVVHITKDSLRDIVIAIPESISEQTAIATALSDTDALIAALDKKIAKKQQIKQGAMQQLLTGKKRLPGFSGEWVEKKLGDICELKNGYAFKSDTYALAGKFYILTIANVQNGFLEIKNCNKIIDIPFDIQEHQKLEPGDLLISMTGNVGRICFVDSKNCLLNQRVGKLLPTNINEKFLYHILRHPNFINAMILKSHGGAQANLSKSEIESFDLIIPVDKREQTAIAQILTDMDNEIAQLQRERDKYREIKAGMMQVLLTGRVRLV